MTGNYPLFTGWIKTALLLTLTFIFYSAAVSAETIYLAKGGARTIKMKETIDTVFTTDPQTVDYNIISDREVVIYGVANGNGEVLIVQNDQTHSIKVVVDPLVGKLTQQIQDQFPGSRIDLKKVGEMYILSGSAADEESRDAIHQIVGDALGLKRETITTEFTGEGAGDVKNNILKYMDYVSFEKLQNRMTLPFANQVNVKLSIVEVNKNYTDSLGLEWGQNSSAGNFSLSKLKFDATSLTTLIHGLENEAIARVLAEPNLSVLSGETADFLVGGEIPMVTSSINGVTVSYKEVGVRMLIAARVENSSKIRLTLSQEVSNVDGQNLLMETALPTLRSRKARTTIELADGESFVLGGLLSESDKETLQKIPFIGDIPILGALFRSTATNREKTELIMVATVNLVRPVSSSKIIYPSFQRSSLMQRFFNVDGIDNTQSGKEALLFLERGGFIY
jgi:pilus assembly protein CpaC